MSAGIPMAMQLVASQILQFSALILLVSHVTYILRGAFVQIRWGWRVSFPVRWSWRSALNFLCFSQLLNHLRRIINRCNAGGRIINHCVSCLSLLLLEATPKFDFILHYQSRPKWSWCTYLAEVENGCVASSITCPSTCSSTISTRFLAQTRSVEIFLQVNFIFYPKHRTERSTVHNSRPAWVTLSPFSVDPRVERLWKPLHSASWAAMKPTWKSLTPAYVEQMNISFKPAWLWAMKAQASSRLSALMLPLWRLAIESDSAGSTRPADAVSPVWPVSFSFLQPVPNLCKLIQVLTTSRAGCLLRRQDRVWISRPRRWLFCQPRGLGCGIALQDPRWPRRGLCCSSDVRWRYSVVTVRLVRYQADRSGGHRGHRRAGASGDPVCRQDGMRGRRLLKQRVQERGCNEAGCNRVSCLDCWVFTRGHQASEAYAALRKCAARL